MARRYGRRIGICSVILSILILLYGQLLAGEMTTSVSFSTSDLIFQTIDAYDVVKMVDCDITRGIGEPQLPVKLVHVALPAGAEIDRIEVLSTESQEIAGRYRVYPVQPPQPYGEPGNTAVTVEFVNPKASVYESSQWYPQPIVEGSRAGSMAGYRLAGIRLYPIQYQPAEGKLLLHRRIDFRVHYNTSGKGDYRLLEGHADRTNEILRGRVERLVLNPEDVFERTGLRGDVVSAVPPGYYEYVIITDESYETAFQPLADWKTKKGVPANIVTTAWIYANYTGVDNQEQVRNFIRDAYAHWGTVWVLLGGDCSDKEAVDDPGPTEARVVPSRPAYAMDFEWDSSQYDENDLQADLYYSDLDGSWNDNGNTIYGEVADNVDLYPDVYVGRAAVNTTEEVNTFVSKVLTYEKPSQTGQFMKMLFLGEIMWDDPYTDGGDGKDMIDDECIPPRFDPITKLYQSRGNENTQSVVAAINEGYHIINHDGHCWWTVMGVGDGYLRPNNMDALTNNPAYGIIYSIGCWPAAFDYDCIAEHYVNNPHGGGVAFVGNSRYGWGSPGNPGWGYSDRIDHRFLYNIFVDDIYHLGAAIDLAKAHYIPHSQQGNVYRLHQYQVNLLGDPELPVWTDDPRALTVEHPPDIVIGASRVLVTVTDERGAVVNGLVCLQKGGDVYVYGGTDAQGQVVLDISPSSAGAMNVTVTGYNVLPYEGTITVTGSGAQLSHTGYELSDVGGNGDGLINPGETISLGVAFSNQGNQAASGVSVVMTTDDDLVTILDGEKDCGTIASGGEVPANGDDFSFMVSSEATNGHVLYLTFEITDESSTIWTSTLGLSVCTPILGYVAHSMDDSDGNGNGVAEPGESVDLTVTFSNSGLARAQGVGASLSTNDPYLTVSGDPISIGTINADGQGQGTFTVAIAGDCPETSFPILTLSIHTSDGYTFESRCLMSVGSMGYGDDMESGEGEWIHEGTDDQWHLSDYRSHSGNHSWYCGDDVTREYSLGMDCSLISPSFGLGPNSELSFWLWFEVATYGVIGVFVEVNAGNGWEKIDFLGSGGALGPQQDAEVPSDWLEYEYSLSSFPIGDAQIRFRFHSETSPYWNGEYIWEGVYIDDVTIAPSGQADLESVQPEIVSTSFTVEDGQGDDDGIVDAGETCQITIDLRNTGVRGANNVFLTLSSGDPDVTITDAEAVISRISVGETVTNTDDTFAFRTDSDVDLHVIPFTVDVVEGEDYYTTQLRFSIRMGQGTVLIVGDDTGSGFASYCEDALDALYVQCDVWEVYESGLVSLETLQAYDDVIWMNSSAQPTLSEEEQQRLSIFLEGGGNLFISGNMIGFTIGSTPFYSDYLHAGYVSFMTRLHHLNVMQNNPVVPDLDIDLAQSGENAQGFPGEIDPIPPAFTLYTYDRTTEEGPGDIRSSGSGAIAFGNDTYKVVYFSFGFEGIEPPETRAAVMDGILSWFRTTIVTGNGDVNNDGVVNILDVVRAVNIILGASQPTEDELARADTNGDGLCNVLDVIGIVNIILFGDTAAKGISLDQSEMLQNMNRIKIGR